MIMISEYRHPNAVVDVLRRVEPFRTIRRHWRTRGVRPPACPDTADWTYNADGLATEHNTDFLSDERFQEAYNLGSATGSWGGADVRFRAYMACWAASHGLGLEGDFVECGVNRGGLARTVIEYTGLGGHSDKRFYLLDTFKGFPERFKKQAASAIPKGHYKECYEDVCATFKDFPNVVIVRGIVPDTLPQVLSEKIAFLSLDMNCAEPEIAAAEYFWDRLSPGASILLDDYAYHGYQRQKLAMDEFAAGKGVPVLSLPTGQGLIIKR